MADAVITVIDNRAVVTLTGDIGGEYLKQAIATQIETMDALAAAIAADGDAAVAGALAGQAAGELAASGKADKSANGSDFADLGQVRANIGLFDTRAAAEAATIATGVDSITTSGFAAYGDGGGATYDRWVVGMDALPPGGEGVWWFEAADGSRWQIARGPEHGARMFGAMGGAGIDALPILTAAFAAPMVKGINIGALAHFFTPGLKVPSGKYLRGINRAVSWLKVIPMSGPVTSGTPRFAVLHENDEGGFSEDYSLDCQRSGDYLAEHGTPHGVVVYAKAGGTCRGTRVRRVDVHNCWGYSHYATTGLPSDGELVDDVWFEDCRAINTNVGFEATGAVRNSGFRNTYVNAAAEDGGTTLACEAFYHHYGAVESFTAQNVVGRGVAQAGVLIFNADSQDIGKIKYENPDIDGQTDFGFYVEERTGNSIGDFEIVGGRFRSTTSGGILRGAAAKITGTQIIGLEGVGLEVGAGAIVDLYSPEIFGYNDPAGSTAAVGIVNQSAGDIRWHGGGRIHAIGNIDSYPVYAPGVEFFGTPELFPSAPVTLPITKEYRIPQSSWINAGTGLQYANLDLTRFRPEGGKGEALMYVSAILEFPFPGPPLDYSMTVLHIAGNLVIRVYIKSATVLTNYVLKAQVTEYSA